MSLKANGGWRTGPAQNALQTKGTHHESPSLPAGVARLLARRLARAEDWIVYEGKDGPGKGKHLVFLSGDEEYRSEEGLPMLAKILSQRHGFKCTVLFAVGKDGNLDPNAKASLPGAEALDSADAIVMLLRFRAYPDKEMKHFVDAYLRGVPIIALRTSTHAFQMPGTSAFKNFSSFGKRVLGEQWVNHWGKHKFRGHARCRLRRCRTGTTWVFRTCIPTTT